MSDRTTQITRPDGYVYLGEWTHADSAAVLGHGEIVVTEHESDSDRYAFLVAFETAVRS